ncbi:protein disulfide isomerase (PDI) protein [Entomortierella beljakovae]|nr:protein disulfide isomerase (PDI) protein [Entomortierella beljakovae]
MKQSLTTIALGALLLSQTVLAGLYSSKDHVIDITTQNFQSEVLDSNHLVMVEFYAPWCGHCKNLVPHYKAAAKNLHGIAKMGAIDCDNDKNRPICAQYDIKGFPTIKAFQPNRSGKKGVKYPKDYQGERTAKAIVDYLVKMLPNDIKLVSSNPTSERVTNIDEFVADDSEPRALLFTKKSVSSNMYKGLATDLKDKMVVAEMRTPSDEVMKKFNIDVPSLLVFPKGSQDPISFSGELKHDPILEFLSEYTESNGGSGNTSSRKNSQSSGSKTSEEADSNTIPIIEFDPTIEQINDQALLTKECLSKPRGSCVISFLVVEPEFPESVQAHNENLELLRKVKKAAYDDSVPLHVVWMDALDKRVVDFMNQFKISSDIPGLLLINPSRKAFAPFMGQFDVQGIREWLHSTANGAGVYPYTFDIQLAEPKVKVTKEAKEEKPEQVKNVKDEL